MATVPQPVGAHLVGESSSRRMFSSRALTDQGFYFRKPWRERFFRCFRRNSAQHGCFLSFTRNSPKVTPGNLELSTARNAATGSPLEAQPGALISMCGKVRLEGMFSLLTGQVGRHVLNWGPVTITPEDGLSVGK